MATPKKAPRKDAVWSGLHAGVAKAASAYFKKAIATHARKKSAKPVEDLADSVNAFTRELRQQLDEALAGTKTELHRAAMRAIFAHWLAGNTTVTLGGWQEVKLPGLTKAEATLVKSLFARTRVQSFSFFEEDRGEDGGHWSSTCKFTIGSWRATATWGAGQNKHDEIWWAEQKLTGWAPDGGFQTIERKVKSGLPGHLLETCIHLIAFDLVHGGRAARPAYCRDTFSG